MGKIRKILNTADEREEHYSEMEDKNILQSGDRMHQPENLANLISTQFGAKVHLH